MKLRLILFLIVFSLLSCSQDDEYPDTPKWLKNKIAQMEKDAIPGTEVVAYRWNDGYYYHIMNPVASCMFCDLYDYSGKKVEWTEDDFKDFHEHGEMINIVWKKPY